mgnify:CR=1 FL=1
MKLSLYEKLLRNKWVYKLMTNFTLTEYIVLIVVVGLILWL